MVKLRVKKESQEKKEEGNKWSQEAAVYMFRPDTAYTCDMCWAWKDGKCALFGAAENIKPYGSCNFFAHFHADEQKVVVPFMGVITKEEAGYEENKEGFTCGRCEYFDGKNGCKKVEGIISY